MRLWFASILGSSFLSSLSDLLWGQPQGMAVAQEVSSSMGEASSPPYFLETFGGFADDVGWYIQVTEDGGAVLTGSTTSFGAGGSDVLVAQLGRNGDLEWAKALGGPDDDVGTQIHQLKDGSFVLSGYARRLGTGGGWDFLITKLNQTGDVDWSRVMGLDNHEFAYSLRVTSDGGFVLGGQRWIGVGKYWDAALIKLDNAGNIEWDKRLGGSKDSMGYAVEVAEDGNFVLAGTTKKYGAGGYDAFVTKLNSTNGDFLWTKTLGGSGDEGIHSIAKTKDGGFVLAGATDGFGAGGQDVMLVKMNPKGGLEWANALGGPGNEVATSVQQTEDGGFIVLSGSTEDSESKVYDKWATRWTAEGGLVWAWSLGSKADIALGSVQEVVGGDFILTGHSKNFSSGGGSDVLVARLNATGGMDNCSTIQSVSPVLTDLMPVLSVANISVNADYTKFPLVNSLVSLSTLDITAFLQNKRMCLSFGFNATQRNSSHSGVDGGLLTQGFDLITIVVGSSVGGLVVLSASIAAVCCYLRKKVRHRLASPRVVSRIRGLGQYRVGARELAVVCQSRPASAVLGETVAFTPGVKRTW